MKTLTYFSVLFFVFSCGTEAQKTVTDYAESITETELKTHLYNLLLNYYILLQLLL